MEKTLIHSAATSYDEKSPNPFPKFLLFLLLFAICFGLLKVFTTSKEGTLQFTDVVDQLPNGDFELKEPYIRQMEREMSDIQQKPRTQLFDEFIDIDKDGNYELSQQRRDKLNRDTSKFNSAEQYVLLARRTGLYPCPSCPFQDSIWLFQFETYRYGITLNGATGRGYSENYLEQHQLFYRTQFRGNLIACKIEELKKIYHYPLLPENLKRRRRLARPPGNPVDH